MGSIRVAVAGVGNCCSSLVQGVYYYQNGGERLGLINGDVGGYGVEEIEFVAAFDIDRRKVGLDLSEAIFSEPNKAPKVAELPALGVPVQMGAALDKLEYDANGVVEVAENPETDIAGVLKDKGVDLLLNLISGSALESSGFYAEAALDAGCALVNATPSPIVNGGWSGRYGKAGVPLVGDDLLDQIGATVVHIGLLEFLHERGVRVDESYQLDVGGGAESVNTLWKTRGLKRNIKTSAVSNAVPYEFPLVSGSTDYVDFLGNSRDSFFWFKGRYFGGAPFTMDVKLNTADAPNAGAVLLDVIRGVKIASDRGLGGAIAPICAYGFKRPPKRHPIAEAYKLFKEFVEG
ncbi:inositol-3-phosphate synthase [Candidatus Bathyarchaeota archaeon]|nr:inositol-3-phosphate synthase [Candidatus Bathyarchaeota archaeon]